MYSESSFVLFQSYGCIKVRRYEHEIMWLSCTVLTIQASGSAGASVGQVSAPECYVAIKAAHLNVPNEQVHHWFIFSQVAWAYSRTTIHRAQSGLENIRNHFSINWPRQSPDLNPAESL